MRWRPDPMNMATALLSILKSSEVITELLSGAPGSYFGAKLYRG